MPYTPQPWSALDFGSQASPYTPQPWGSLSFDGGSGSLQAVLGFQVAVSGYVAVGGPLSAVLPVSAEIVGEVGVISGRVSAMLDFPAVIRIYQDWLEAIPPVQLQEVYRLIVTADGQDDLVVGGISSWQATSQTDGRSSYLQAVIPAPGDLVDGLIDRSDGYLIIEMGYRFSDGSERYEEILRARFDDFRPEEGGTGASSATVSGYLSGKVAETSHRELKGVQYMNSAAGRRRVRCDLDLFLQPGMTVTALGQSFRAGYINYYVNETSKFCEVGER